MMQRTDALTQCQEEISKLKQELATTKHSLVQMRREAVEHKKHSDVYNELRYLTLEELSASMEENSFLRMELEALKQQKGTQVHDHDNSSHPCNDNSSIDLERTIQSILDQDGSKESIGAVILPSFIPLQDLPDEIRSIDQGMNALPEVKSAPVRFIKLDSLLSWDKLVVYEEVKADDMIEMPYDVVGEDVWRTTAVLSWRWNDSKPWTYEQYLARTGFTPMSEDQLKELQSSLRENREIIDRIWVDWSCVCQYIGSPMTEVLRSKIFYARSILMLVLPTFGPLPKHAVLCALLGQVESALTLRSTKQASLAAKCIRAICAKKRLADRSYFSRVWCLAERLARYGRDERLCNWLTLESWIGMLLDAIFTTVEDESSMAVYRKLLGPESLPLVNILAPLLQDSVQSGTLKSSQVKSLVADLCELGVKAWLQSTEASARLPKEASLDEAPNTTWLKSYLGKESTSGVYQAFSQADRVWSIYTFFVWKPVVDTSSEALRYALDLLVELISNDKEAAQEARSQGMFIQLGLESNPEGWTPLHRACVNGRTEAVKSLVTSLHGKKEELHEKDNETYTPLILAAQRGYVEAARALIEAGARVDDTCRFGYSALMYASGQGPGDNEDMIELLIESGAQINHHSNDGYTALMWASGNGRLGSAKLLLKAGANIEAVDNNKCTPLMIAAESGYEDLVRLFVESGANVDSRSVYGTSPLSSACKYRYHTIVQLLLDVGADTGSVDLLGRSPLDWAREMGYSDIMDLLKTDKARIKVEPSGDSQNKGNSAVAASEPELLGYSSLDELLKNQGASASPGAGAGAWVKAEMAENVFD